MLSPLSLVLSHRHFSCRCRAGGLVARPVTNPWLLTATSRYFCQELENLEIFRSEIFNSLYWLVGCSCHHDEECYRSWWLFIDFEHNHWRRLSYSTADGSLWLVLGVTSPNMLSSTLWWTIPTPDDASNRCLLSSAPTSIGWSSYSFPPLPAYMKLKLKLSVWLHWSFVPLPWEARSRFFSFIFFIFFLL